MSCCRGCVTDALIDESGVRRSCETARRSAVRSASVSLSRAAMSLRLQASPVERGGQLGGERLEHAAGPQRRGPGRERESRVVTELDDGVASSSVVGRV